MATVLTKPQLDELRRKLEEERTRILRVLQTPAGTPAQRDQESEIEEVAQRATERTQALAIEARERALLAEVERALTKLNQGKYGLSEKTGEPIRYERLAAMPWARQDVDE
jgi:DnaK suppressor protein